MNHTLSKPIVRALVTITAALLTAAAPTAAVLAKSAPITHPVSISQGGPNLAIDQTVAGTAAGWTLTASGATPVSNSNQSPANVALVYGYRDAKDYNYVDFSTAAAPLLSGIFQVTNGQAVEVMGLPSTATLSAGQPSDLQIRADGSSLRLYIGSTFIFKTALPAPAGYFGVGAMNSNASFANATVATPGSATLNPAAVSSTVSMMPLTQSDTGLPQVTNPVMTASIGPVVNVSTSTQLADALASAVPGETISLAPGIYSGAAVINGFTGSFAINASGTAGAPITLTGPSDAIITGNGNESQYALYMNNANYWNVTGLTFENAGKGVVLDASSNDFFQGITIENTGDEGIHFRDFSSNNVLEDSTVSGTGQHRAGFGEGVYIGSANSNWCTYTNCQPDGSNGNIIIGNSVSNTSAEAVDIKEGTSGGLVYGNNFDGSALAGKTGAESTLNAKGNAYLIENNTATNSNQDGMQVNTVYPGWGENNVFIDNTILGTIPGYGFNVETGAQTLYNDIFADNNATTAALGASDVALLPVANE